MENEEVNINRKIDLSEEISVEEIETMMESDAEISSEEIAAMLARS